MELNILFENRDFIILIKPPGIPSQEDKTGDFSMPHYIKEYLAKSGKISECFVIHRLDRAVSGIMVYAKTSTAAKLLSQSFFENTKKLYSAVVSGTPQAQAELTDYMVKNERLNFSRIAHKNEKTAKSAVLSYEKISETGDNNQTLSLLKINLKTGRHHQIRLQLSHANLPIIGDTKYGAKNDNTKPSRPNAVHVNIALFAHGLEFKYKNRCYSYTADLPEFYPFSLFKF